MFNFDTDAISQEKGESAKEILKEFIQTGPQMVFEHSMAMAVEPTAPAAPQASAPAGPGGSSNAARRQQQAPAQADAQAVPETATAEPQKEENLTEA
tara:strand:- start:90 stop:380 length:291 start_codon:yes stop_codon:yes gene_type:complete